MSQILKRIYQIERTKNYVGDESLFTKDDRVAEVFHGKNIHSHITFTVGTWNNHGMHKLITETPLSKKFL